MALPISLKVAFLFAGNLCSSFLTLFSEKFALESSALDIKTTLIPSLSSIALIHSLFSFKRYVAASEGISATTLSVYSFLASSPTNLKIDNANDSVLLTFPTPLQFEQIL